LKTPEGIVKDEIKAYLKARGAYFFMPVQTGFGASTLDFLCCINGIFVGVETKRRDKAAKETPRQSKVIEDIRKAGGVALVARSVADLEKALKDNWVDVEAIGSDILTKE